MSSIKTTIQTQEALTGTWRVSETLKNEAVYEFCKWCGEDITEIQDADFEIKFQGTMSYDPCGDFLHKLYMEISCSCEDAHFRLRYYSKYSGSWICTKSNKELLETYKQVDTLCLDEETEEITNEDPEFLELLNSVENVDEPSILEFLGKNKAVIMCKDTNLRFDLTREISI